MTDGDRLVQLINAQPNFPDRQIDPYLMELAQKRALEIQTAPNHRPLLELAPSTDFGEVLAWNQWYPDPVERFVVGSWTRSDSHRQLLENPAYKYIGAGVTHYGDHQSAGCAIVKVTPVEEPVTETKAIVAVYGPDALVASRLVSRYDAPILYVTRISVPTATRSELERLAPDEILVIGGTGVIADSVAAELRQIAPVRRIAGPDRYATAVEVSRA